MPKSLTEQIEELMGDEKPISLIVVGFNGATKKGTITEEGYEILSKEMEKRGFNQARTEMINKIPELIKLIREDLLFTLNKE